MQKNFTSYELKVLHYRLLNVEETHLIFKSPQHLNKGILSLNFVDLIWINNIYNAQITYGIFFLGMDIYHPIIIRVNTMRIVNFAKWTLGQVFFY
jgi:hypothetical protein